jgi:ribokinase
VVGSANYDYTIVTNRLPRPGESVGGRDFVVGLGGKGANQAVACGRLGGRVALIANVGADDGAEILRALAGAGVDTAAVLRDPGIRTGVAMIAVDRSGEKQIIAWGGANHALLPEDVRGAADVIRAARVLLLQLEIPLASVMEAVTIARDAGVTVILDPAPASPLPEELYRSLDLIRPNAHEAETLTGVVVTDRASARRAAHILLDRGVGAASVQAGAEGDLIVARDREIFLPRFPVASVDATGAGDAFAGTLALELARGATLEEAGPRASAAAAFTTTSIGAQNSLPRPEDIDRLLDERRRARR